jgi:hypothetical protein
VKRTVQHMIANIEAMCVECEKRLKYAAFAYALELVSIMRSKYLKKIHFWLSTHARLALRSFYAVVDIHTFNLLFLKCPSVRSGW